MTRADDDRWGEFRGQVARMLPGLELQVEVLDHPDGVEMRGELPSGELRVLITPDGCEVCLFAQPGVTIEVDATTLEDGRQRLEQAVRDLPIGIASTRREGLVAGILATLLELQESSDDGEVAETLVSGYDIGPPEALRAAAVEGLSPAHVLVAVQVQDRPQVLSLDPDDPAFEACGDPMPNELNWHVEALGCIGPYFVEDDGPAVFLLQAPDGPQRTAFGALLAQEMQGLLGRHVTVIRDIGLLDTPHLRIADFVIVDVPIEDDAQLARLEEFISTAGVREIQPDGVVVLWEPDDDDRTRTLWLNLSVGWYPELLSVAFGINLQVRTELPPDELDEVGR